MKDMNAMKRAKKAALAVGMSALMLGGSMAGTVMQAGVVFADDVQATKGNVDFGKGSASITINGNQGQSLEGKTFTVYQLFNAENSDGGESINYTFSGKYDQAIKTVVAAALTKSTGKTVNAADVTEYMAIDYIQSLNDGKKVEGAQATQKETSRYSAFRYFVEQVRDEIVKEGVAGDTIKVKSATADNKLVIGGLAYGYYIVDETSKQAADGSSYFASSLCMVNTANPEATINIKSDYPSIIKKVQEDDNKNGLGNDGWNDVADYEIGQTVPFKYTSTIPDMYGYETYKYIWHDKMGAGLTFHNNKSEISITIKQGSKTYKLADGEYDVVTDGLAEGETFNIKVDDIKKIVDEHFDNMDKDKKNDYSNMTVELTYNATVNENADTGRGANENGVQLEFSNNADSNGSGETGKTPWDTVVVFTYELDATKINNHDKQLAGAQFRLYSDADCQNEVFVQKSTTAADLYTVINRDSLGGTDHTGGAAAPGATVMTSDDKGAFKIKGLDSGTYYLKEVKAPAGYRLLLDPITINVKATYTADRNNYVAGDAATDKTLTNLAATAHIKEFYDGKYKESDSNLTTDLENGTAAITVVNEVGAKLPITGSSAMLIMLGAGVALAGGAIVVDRKKKGAVAK